MVVKIAVSQKHAAILLPVPFPNADEFLKFNVKCGSKFVIISSLTILPCCCSLLSIKPLAPFYSQ